MHDVFTGYNRKMQCQLTEEQINTKNTDIVCIYYLITSDFSESCLYDVAKLGHFHLISKSLYDLHI